MAKKQSRRTVSMNRNVYEAAKQEAASRGMTLAGLVEAALATYGVPVEQHEQQTPDLVRQSMVRRAESMARRPSRERQVLGDQIADAYGFH
jgi:hypothetical protein